MDYRFQTSGFLKTGENNMIVMLSRIVDICICEKYMEESNLSKKFWGGEEGVSMPQLTEVSANKILVENLLVIRFL